MNSLKLKASRDLVYNAIAKGRDYVYNSDREVFVANWYGSYDTVIIGKTVDGQYTFESPERQSIRTWAESINPNKKRSLEYVYMDYFDSVMTLAREKY